MNTHRKSLSLLLPLLLSASRIHAVEFISLNRRASDVSNLPTNISTIDKETIENVGAANVTEMLDLIPGADAQRSGSLGTLSSVRLRGVPTSNQVQILVDDQPVGGVSIQENNLSLIPVENVERIEVVRGASSVLYGANAIGGVINIITRKAGEKPYIYGGFEGRSFQTKIFRGGAGGRLGDWDASVTGFGYETGGYIRNSNGISRSGSADVGYRFGNGGRVSLNLFSIENEFGSPNGTPISMDHWNGDRERAPSSATQFVNNDMDRARVKVVAPLTSQLQIESLTYGSREDYQLFLDRGGALLSEFDNTIMGNDTRVMMSNGMTFGGGYERDERDSLGQVDRHVTNWALYGQQEFHVGRLSLLPALRFDQHGTFGNQYNPRFAAVYRAGDNWKVSSSAARSFRAPTLVDLYIVAQDPFFPAADFFGNPNLRPETAWTYDAGVEGTLCFGLRAGLSGFYTRIKDRINPIDTDGNGFNDTLRNLSRAEISGVEIELAGDTGPFTHRANYTWLRARGTSATSSDYVPLRLTPNYMGTYQLSWNGPIGLKAVNTLQYVDKQYENDGDRGDKLPSYLLWNIRVEETWKNYTVFAGVDNVTDKLYAESFTFGNPVPQPTRTYRAGLEVRFAAAPAPAP